MNQDYANVIRRTGRAVLNYGFYIVFVILVISYFIISPRFLSLANISSILIQASPLLVLGTGLTIVILIGGIDLSVGSTASLAAAVGAVMINRGYNPVLAIMIMPLIGLVVGVVNGLIITRVGLNPLLTTLAMLFVLRGMSLHVMNGGNVPVISRLLDFFGTGYLGPIPVAIMIFLVFTIFAQIVIKRTSFGRHILAIGTNEVAARQAGIAVRRTKFITYVICGFTAGFAGLIWASRFGSANPNIGTGMEFIGVTIVVIGGTSLAGGEGSIIPGTLFGALLLLIIENGLNLAHADIYFYPLVRGLVLFLAVLIDSIKNTRTWSLTG
jgi:ribose transport system permease protein